ncbi:MAG: hypothetical protein ACPGL0_04710 [Limisphaerales bacterium]
MKSYVNQSSIDALARTILLVLFVETLLQVLSIPLWVPVKYWLGCQGNPENCVNWLESLNPMGHHLFEGNYGASLLVYS